MATPYYNCPEASLHGAETGEMSVEQQHTETQRCLAHVGHGQHKQASPAGPV